jgi:hypothetical protein
MSANQVRRVLIVFAMLAILGGSAATTVAGSAAARVPHSAALAGSDGDGNTPWD